MATTVLSGLSEKIFSFKAEDPPLTEITPPQDRAFSADSEKKALLSATSQVKHLTPYIGTELVGVQLSQLNSQQKDDLGLLVAERGVVFFRGQDLTLEQQHQFTEHYGIQDRDPNQVDPRHVTILGRGGDIREYGRTANGEYHSDHSFEINPPAYTLLRVVKTPAFGGDTIFTSQTALYDKLSPVFQKTFEGLHGVHSSEQYFLDAVNNGAKTFRYPVRTEHPLVRTHPVTKIKSLFYNPSFVTHIAELKNQEAIHTLNFLREHLHAADDLSVRWKWEPGSVAFWDNRIVVHRAVPGGYNVEEREGKRTAVYGEKPFYDSKGQSLREWNETYHIQSHGGSGIRNT